MDPGVEQRAESSTPMESSVDEQLHTEEGQNEPEDFIEYMKTEATHLKKKDQTTTSEINYEEGSNARSSEGSPTAFVSAAETIVSKKGPGKDQHYKAKVKAKMTKIGKIFKNEENTEETPVEEPEKGMKRRNWEVKQSQVNYEDGVTVFFHAILSKDFKGESAEPRVFIRAEGISGYNDWEDNICELFFTQNVGKHEHLIEGFVTISMDNMDKPIPYKYYVVCGEEGEYEFIPKESPEAIHVNRCLFIQLKYLSGTDWHQFDDVIYKSSSRKRSFSSNKKSNIVEKKKKAVQIMLDRLFTLNPCTPCSVKNFFQQFQQFYLVNRKLMVHEGEPKEWTDLQFDEKQLQNVIKDYLEDVAYPGLYQKSATWNTSEYERLVLTLTIFLLSGDFSFIPQLEKECTRFCSLLCLKEQPLAMEMNEVKEAFSEISWCLPDSQNPSSYERLGLCLRLFCNFCIVTQVHQWLWTIPVLHLFTDFEYVQENAHLESEDAWARLKGLPFTQCRIEQGKNTSEKSLLPLMKEKKYLVKENRALFRSWFSLLPLRDLAEFISDFPAETLDYLLGIFHRLKDVKATYHTCEEVEKLLMKVLNDLYNKKNRMLQQDTWNSCVTVCQRLHGKICSKFQNLRYYKIPAISVCIFSRILEFAPSEASRDQALQNTLKTVYQALCDTTRNWFCAVLPAHMLTPRSDLIVELTFPMELEVCNLEHHPIFL